MAKVTAKKKTAASKGKAKTTTKKATTKKATATAKKTSAKKSPVTKKKAAAKTAVKKKVVAKKEAPAKTKASAAKKTATKKAVAKKAVSKKAPAKKTADQTPEAKSPKATDKKKAAPKKEQSTETKATTKKAAAKKAPAKKAGSKKKKADLTPAAKNLEKGLLETSVSKIDDEDEDGTAFPSSAPVIRYEKKKNSNYMNEKQVANFRRILAEWKQQLMEEVDRTVGHMKDDATNFPDPNDRATQEEEFSLELRTRDRERKLIKKINEAQKRIDDEEYGYCETCGIEIGIERLEARPTAELCFDCKTLEEIRERQIA